MAQDKPGTSVSRVGAIWAQDRHGALGAQGDMLWRVPADFRHFKEATVGGVVIMGRTTWDSLATALPGRRSIVLTRQPSWQAEEATGAVSLSQALAIAGDLEKSLPADPRQSTYRCLPRVWIIGGASVYAQAMRAGVIDELVVSTLDIDATEAARERSISLDDIVYAPRVSHFIWAHDDEASDPPAVWRPVSADASWRVDYWTRRACDEQSL